MATYALHTLFGLRGALESVKGTDLTPTRILYPTKAEEGRNIGSIAIKPLRSSYRPTTLVYPGIDKTGVKISGPFLYDEQAFWLALGVKGGLSGTGAGADKSWALIPSNTADDVKSATLQYGWVGGPTLWKLNYLQLAKYALHISKDSEVTYDVDLVTPKVPAEIGAFTGSLTDLTHVAAVGTTAQCYVDPAGGTIGATAEPYFISADWELDKAPVVTYPTNATGFGADIVRPNAEDWKLSLTRLYATNAERTAWIAKTEQKIRLAAVGPGLGSSTYKLWLDLYGYIDAIDPTEVDGVVAEKVTFLPLFDATATGDYAITLVNSLAAIS